MTPPLFASETKPMPSGGVSRPLAFALIVAVAAVWFLTLGPRHLLPSDEGRYAEIAREMFATGDWVTIRYNGLKYFEKPPFHLWATALAYHAFGVGDWQARLWVAVSGAGGLLVTMLGARRWFGSRVALLSGLVLLAAPTWAIASHFNSLDMSVSGALACVLAGLLLAQHPLASASQTRGWMWFTWAAMALAVLTKGLIGIVLPGMVVVVYTLIARDWALWRRLHLVSGALLMLAIAAPWFVLVSMRNPEFPYFFFIHEHWLRYTSSAHHRSAPWWYFVPQLVVGFLPWLALSRRMALAVRDDARGRGFRPVLLLGVWVAAIFVFFSLSGSKLPGYIVPIFPALAILAALALDRLEASTWARYVLASMVVIAAVLLAAATIALSSLGGAPDAPARVFATWIAATSALALAGLVLAWRLNRSAPDRSITLYSLTLFGFVSVGLLGHEAFGRKSSGVDLVASMQAILTPAMPIYSVRRLDHTLPYYLRRTTIMVEEPDELDFGTRQEPQKWLPTMGAFVNAWSSGPRALAIMSPATYAALRSDNVAMFPIAQDARRVVVANFAKPTP